MHCWLGSIQSSDCSDYRVTGSVGFLFRFWNRLYCIDQMWVIMQFFCERKSSPATSENQLAGLSQIQSFPGHSRMNWSCFFDFLLNISSFSTCVLLSTRTAQPTCFWGKDLCFHSEEIAKKVSSSHSKFHPVEVFMGAETQRNSCPVTLNCFQNKIKEFFGWPQQRPRLWARLKWTLAV